MNQLDFECEVLTPLFLGSAETRVNPELRSPSVRGALRYWYRALLGGSSLIPAGNDGDKLNALKEYETHVFGAQEIGSPISVRVKAGTGLEIATFRKDRAIRTAEGFFLPSGKDYLLWSMAASGRPDTPRYLPEREYIKPGTKFYVELQAWRKSDAAVLKKAAAALWLLANLGAIGARVSRGAGSFQALLKSPAEDLLVLKLCQSVDELCLFLSKGIRQCLSLICDDSGGWSTFEEMPCYDVLSPTTAEVWVVGTASTGWGSFVEALNGIGEKLRDFRSHRFPLGQGDHNAVLDWLEGRGRNPQIKRAAFGLPIPFRYSGSGLSDVIISELGDRRVSPLRIRISRLTTGKHVGILTFFKSRFLQEGKRLQLQTRKWTAPPPNDYKVLQDFIQTFEVKRRVTL